MVRSVARHDYQLQLHLMHSQPRGWLEKTGVAQQPHKVPRAHLASISWIIDPTVEEEGIMGPVCYRLKLLRDASDKLVIYAA